MLLNYHIGSFVFSSLCVGDLLWLGLSSVVLLAEADVTCYFISLLMCSTCFGY